MFQRIPKSFYKTRYPHNKARITPSGHIIEIDDTPGAERLRVGHKNGTYVEIGPDGTRVDFTTGNSHQYAKSGLSITVDHNHDVKIHGHQRVCIGGGSHIEVAGDASIMVAGDSLTGVAGNMKAAVAGDAQLSVAGNSDMQIDGNMNMKVGGSTTMETAGDHIIKAATIKLNP